MRSPIRVVLDTCQSMKVDEVEPYGHVPSAKGHRKYMPILHMESWPAQLVFIPSTPVLPFSSAYSRGDVEAMAYPRIRCTCAAYIYYIGGGDFAEVPPLLAWVMPQVLTY
jgi:hypothetical protein